jgi:xanthine dehydrogenase YagT iron-sulfur-binding subunit
MPPIDDDLGSMTALEKFSRRDFLSGASATGVATTATALTAPVANAQVDNTQEETETRPIPGAVPVALKVNGKTYRIQLDPRATVLDTLRETLHLTGTKKGCDHGQCGACTVHINGRRANSCLVFAVMQQNAEITTIEGLGTPESMHPMQAAFLEHEGYQCGYCTSGQIMSAAAMLHEPWAPADDDVKEALSGNICRCGAYPNVIAAVQAVRRKQSKV